MRKTLNIILLTVIAITTMSSCSSKIMFIGQLLDAGPERIPESFRYSEPDGGYQIVQTDDKTYLWLATNGSVYPDGQVFEKAKIKDLSKSRTIKSRPAIDYFDHKRYRVVRMPSTGEIFSDVFYLFEEFEKVPNAKTLKFSSCNEANGLDYLFVYKK